MEYPSLNTQGLAQHAQQGTVIKTTRVLLFFGNMYPKRVNSAVTIYIYLFAPPPRNGTFTVQAHISTRTLLPVIGFGSDNLVHKQHMRHEKIILKSSKIHRGRQKTVRSATHGALSMSTHPLLEEEKPGKPESGSGPTGSDWLQ